MSTADHEARRYDPGKADRLNNPKRLQTQVSDTELAALLELRGDESLADLGSGTGFYTDFAAALTSGTVYAVEISPEMIAAYEDRGVPANVKTIQGDITQVKLPLGSIDAAYSVVTYHETAGDLNFPALLAALRPPGKLVVVDWRKDPEGWESGPPAEERFTAQEVAESLTRYFEKVETGKFGRFLFWVVASGMRPHTGAGTTEGASI